MKCQLLAACLLLPLWALAQDYIESFSHNSDFHNAERTVQYVPDADGFLVSHNGKNLYTRALYGTNTLWRLETSDMPIFAAYHKTENRNIHFTVDCGGTVLRLDSVADCKAAYKGGERKYTLTDPAWGKGAINVTVVALADDEGAVWEFSSTDMPVDAKLTANCCSTVKIKLNRSGDMGADPANCFAPDPERANLRQCSINIGGNTDAAYIEYFDRDVTSADQSLLKQKYDEAQTARNALTSRITIETPDPLINTLAANLLAAADGIWDGQTYQHGAVGWRMPLSGWRGAYTGDFLGWHDRARQHFDAYAASQVVDEPATIPHPTQDPKMNLARAEKRWGTQMYSNGYICRNPNSNHTMHHYDMNLCYIDELLWHLQWTGDLDYARKIWPTIKSSLEWEKRNFDPDDDGLYDAYCCIWASDALYYNSGAVTHSSAYNYRANNIAATIASRIGEDPTPYAEEARKIKAAINDSLWVEETDKAVWAEFKDKMGHRMLHKYPGVWTIYHAIDSEVGTDLQNIKALRYIDNYIPHIPVAAEGLNDNGQYVISTTNWKPYAWSINNVAFAEIYHTALAYFLGGRRFTAKHILQSAMTDGMMLGNSPGNIGQISFYDAARGECYRDFADPVGVLSRVLVQGLFGFTPNLLDRNIIFRPGIPADWENASMTHPDFKITYESDNTPITLSAGEAVITVPLTETYKLHLSPEMLAATDSVNFVIPNLYSNCIVNVLSQNDLIKKYECGSDGYFFTDLAIPAHQDIEIFVIWMGEKNCFDYAPIAHYHPSEAVTAQQTLRLSKPHANYKAKPVSISKYCNANITDIFKNEYLSPRSPYTTLQLPVHGMGEWCHPKDTANIDDSALRNHNPMIENEKSGFKFVSKGNNVIYTSLYDNYPDKVTIPLSGKADEVSLFMVGSTNHMQCHVVNGTVSFEYTDGSTISYDLVPPFNWVPIEQDLYYDGKAFQNPNLYPIRFRLKDCEDITNCRKDIPSDQVYGRRIDGGAGTLLYFAVDPKKKLKSMTIESIANEVVIGVAAASLIKYKD